MYNLSSLYYQMISNGVVFGIVGLICLVCSHFWNLDKRNVKELSIGIVFLILCMCSLGKHYFIIAHPEISVHEGAFVDEHRSNPYLFRREYCFTNEEGLKPIFYLDIFSKKNIYPKEFEKGKMYRIYYEEKLDVIVKVEKLE